MNDAPVNDSPPTSGRRRFLTRAAAVAALPLAAGLFAGREWLQQSAAAQSFRLDRFQPQVGSLFTVTDAAAPLSLTLTKAEALPLHQPQVAEQFSLLFTVADGQPLEDRIYTLQHPVLGSLEMFISPVGPHQKGQPQPGEAVFNFARQPA